VRLPVGDVAADDRRASIIANEHRAVHHTVGAKEADGIVDETSVPTITRKVSVLETEAADGVRSRYREGRVSG